MATIKYLADINLDKNSLNNAVIQNLSTAPSSPADGQIYYDTDTNDLNIYNGSGWVQLGATGAGDIESVVAGDGLTGGATSGDATLNVVGGTGITANANDIAIDSTVATLSGSQTLTNKTIAASQVTEISNLTAGEGAQLENIGSTTISAAQWGYLGAATGAITNSDTVDMGDGFVLEDADGTEVTITENKEVKFTGTGGLTINWTDVDNGTDGDPFDLQFAIGTLNQNTTGSAATLTTARNIGGVSFNGSAAIDLPGVNTGGNQDTTGNAATATKIASITNSNIVQLTASQTLTNKTIAASQVTEISNITAAEGAQLENIGSTTISATQWGYLGAASGAITNTDVDVSVANLKTRLAGGFGSNAVTIGDSSDVVTIGNDLVVTGDLTVSGDTTTVNTATLSVEDPLIILASGNAGDAVDTGFYSKYVESSTTKYAGVFRDVSASGNPFTFFDGNQAEPTTTVNTAGTGYDLADISAGGITAADGFTGDITGDVTGNADTATTLATARTIGGVSFNGSANISLVSGSIPNNAADTTGNAATATLAADATTLATARTIAGVSFDGSANISLNNNAITNGAGYTTNTGDITSVSIGTNDAGLVVTSGDVDWDLVGANGISTAGSGGDTITITAANAGTGSKGVIALATTAEALAGTDTGKAVTAAGLAARSYRAAIGDGSATAIAVSHGLATRDVNVQMYDASSFETVMAQVVRTSTEVVTVTFNTAPGSGDVIILINKID